MTLNALVVDNGAIEALDAALIDEEWFNDFIMPENSVGLRRVVISNVVFILSNTADVGSGFLVVNIGGDGVFSGALRKRPRFERILRVAMRHFDRNVSLPVQWRAYHDGSRLSVYAEPKRNKAETRLYFDQAAGVRNDLYAYGISDGPTLLADVTPNMILFNAAIGEIENAIYTEQPPALSVGNFGILLNERLGAQVGGSATLKQWLDSRLNREQLAFVSKSHEAPVRLRGAAGTGKTQAMVIKCVKDIYDDADGENSKTFAFLTHSSALAHEVVRGMLYALDPSERWQTLKTADNRPKLWTGTIYELAQEQLNYGRKGLNPLSLDGREGRDYQRILIDGALTKITADARIIYGVLGTDTAFAERLASSKHRPALVEELMNEFACVLDADNVRKGTRQADLYLTSTREPWQMPLESLAQREVVLEIHDVYRSLLKHERLLSMDQMIADYSRYLSTHEWEQLRDRDGFDVIFVDEYHYFSRVEAVTLQSLFRSRAQTSGRWPLFMAYDLKQSTNDTALSGGLERFRNPGVGKSTQVELVENYRSTPQITAFLQDLDAAFPSMDLEGEYNTHIANSKQANGDKPTLQIFDSNTQLLDNVFATAGDFAREIGGRNVAVLSLNEDLFDLYRKAGRIHGKFVPITSREDLKELQFARSRCVFSMPEYVAGLQFEVVFLIHADQVDLADEFLSQGARRRYVNRVYLGASRAQGRLEFYATKERGGRSEILEGPLHNGSLLEIG